MKPLCVDLFCGLGGWTEGFLAEGYECVGVDNDPRFATGYEALGGHFVLADVRDLDGRDFRGARCIVASPPCARFSIANVGWGINPSRPDGKWTRTGQFRLRTKQRDPEAGMVLVREAFRICQEAARPFLIENVGGAIQAISAEYGPPRARHRPWYLWGNFPGFIAPIMTKGTKHDWNGKHMFSGRSSVEVAKIPLPLARAVARGFL